MRHHVFSVPDADERLQALIEGPPTVIVLDIWRF
jgi:hypothetical protein